MQFVQIYLFFFVLKFHFEVCVEFVVFDVQHVFRFAICVIPMLFVVVCMYVF